MDQRKKEEEEAQGVATPVEDDLWGPEVENLLENQTSVPSGEQEEPENTPGTNFSDDLFAPPGKSRKRLSRTQRREQARRRMLHIETMQQSQRDDPDVQRWRQQEDSS